VFRDAGRHIASFTFALALIALAIAPPGAAQVVQVATLTVAQGRAAILRADGTAISPAPSGTSLGAGDRVATFAGSSAFVTFFDGSEMELGAEATVIIKEAGGEAARVNITLESVVGTTVHRVVTITGGSSYRVETGGTVAVVRGTVFAHHVDFNGDVTVALERCDPPPGAPPLTSVQCLEFPSLGRFLRVGERRTATARGEEITGQFSLGQPLFNVATEPVGRTGLGTDNPGQETGSRTVPQQTSLQPDDDKDQGPVVVITAIPAAVPPAAVPDAHRLIAFAARGTRILVVSNQQGLAVGDTIILNPGGPTEESAVIVGFGSVFIDRDLRFDHVAFEPFISIPRGGSTITPNPSPTPTLTTPTVTASTTTSPTATPTSSATSTVTATATPTVTASITPTGTTTSTLTSTPTLTNTPTQSPTATNTSTGTPTPTGTPSPTPTETPTPTSTPTETPTPTATSTATSTPTSTSTPTITPTPTNTPVLVGCTKTYIGASGGTWQTAGNWSPAGLPGSTDTVCVPAGKQVYMSPAGGTTYTISKLLTEPTSHVGLQSGTLNINAASILNGTFGIDLTATLGGTGQVTSNSFMWWWGGTITGSAELISNADMDIRWRSTSIPTLNGRTLRLASPATANVLTDASAGGFPQIAVRTGGAIIVDSGATLHLQGTGRIDVPSGSGTITNAGTLLKSGSTNTSIVEPSYTNTGTVTVQAGQLSFDGGGTNSSLMQTTGPAATSAFRFNGGTFTHTNASTVQGANVAVDSGTISFQGTYDITNSTTVVAGSATWTNTSTVLHVGGLNIGPLLGTATFNSGETIAARGIQMGNGTLQGSDLITTANGLNWTAGTIGGSNEIQLNAPSTITAAVSGNPLPVLDGRTLRVTNGVTASVFGAAATSWEIRDGASIIIDANGTLDLQTGGRLDAAGTGSKTLTNNGTLRRSGNTSTSIVEPVVTNNATVTVQAGQLSFDGGGTNSSLMQTTGPAATSAFRFNGGTFTNTSASTVQGANVAVDSGTISFQGTYDITNSTTVVAGSATWTNTSTVLHVGGLNIGPLLGTATFNSGETIAAGGIQMGNGTLQGSDLITTANGLNWTAGTIGGSNEIQLNAPSTITAQLGGNPLPSLSGRTLRITNGVTATVNGIVNSSWDIRNGAQIVIDSGGTLNLTSSGRIDAAGTGTKTITNNGTLRRSGNVNTTDVELIVNNAATVEALAGTLVLSAAYTQTAGETRVNGGTLDPNSTFTLQGGQLTGSGNVQGAVSNSGGDLSPGVGAGSDGDLNLVGAYSQSATSTFTVELGPTGADVDRVDITGAATLDGTLNVSLVGGFTPSPSQVFTIMTFTSRTGTFAAENLPPGFTIQYSSTDVTLTAP
jgi:hypothetical protein